MKVSVNYDLCESNALCMEALPTVFEVRDDNFLYLLKEEVGPDEQDAAREAARVCPRQAITLTD